MQSSVVTNISSDDEAVLSVAETVGELMEYWGFKRIHGALWTILYLSPEPMTQQALMQQTGYSKGAISMALNELNHWGVVRIERPLKGRGRWYRAETDLGAMVRNVVERREQPLLDHARQRFREARSEFARSHEPAGKFRVQRLETLLGLTSAGMWTIDQFVRTGTLPFTRLRRYFEKGLAGVSKALQKSGGSS